MPGTDTQKKPAPATSDVGSSGADTLADSLQDPLAAPVQFEDKEKTSSSPTAVAGVRG